MRELLRLHSKAPDRETKPSLMLDLCGAGSLLCIVGESCGFDAVLDQRSRSGDVGQISRRSRGLCYGSVGAIALYVHS